MTTNPVAEIISSTPDPEEEPVKKSQQLQAALKPKLNKLYLMLFAPQSNDEPDKGINLPALIISIFAIIILIIIGYFIYQVVRPNPYGDAVNIPNLTKEVKGLTRKEQDLIRHNLYNSVAKNSETDKKLKTVTGLVRQGSVTNNDDTYLHVHSGSFIIDFAKLEQSYKVSFEYAKEKEGERYIGGYNVIVSCLTTPDEIIYPDFACQTSSPDSYADPVGLLISKLPHYGKTEDGLEYTVLYRHYSNGEPYLEVAINSCGDQAIINRALAAAKDWLKSQDFNPDDYAYEAPATYCPGASPGGSH